MGFHIPSPARAVEVVGAYAASGALGYLYFEWRTIVPQIMSAERANIFLWLNESIGLMSVVLWVWVTAYTFAQAFTFANIRYPKALSVTIASITASFIALVALMSFFVVLIKRFDILSML